MAKLSLFYPALFALYFALVQSAHINNLPRYHGAIAARQGPSSAPPVSTPDPTPSPPPASPSTPAPPSTPPPPPSTAGPPSTPPSSNPVTPTPSPSASPSASPSPTPTQTTSTPPRGTTTSAPAVSTTTVAGQATTTRATTPTTRPTNTQTGVVIQSRSGATFASRSSTPGASASGSQTDAAATGESTGQSSSFMENKPAVAALFTVLGVVGAGLIAGIAFIIYKRRQRRMDDDDFDEAYFPDMRQNSASNNRNNAMMRDDRSQLAVTPQQDPFASPGPRGLAGQWQDGQRQAYDAYAQDRAGYHGHPHTGQHGNRMNRSSYSNPYANPYDGVTYPPLNHVLPGRSTSPADDDSFYGGVANASSAHGHVGGRPDDYGYGAPAPVTAPPPAPAAAPAPAPPKAAANRATVMSEASVDQGRLDRNGLRIANF